MKEIKIEVPKGYEVDKENSTFERIIFKEVKKEVTSRIKTPEDAIRELGECDEDVKDYRKLESLGVSSHILNNQLAIVIVKALNEGWVGDWDNSNEGKYFPWFYLGKNFRYHYYDSWHSDSIVSARLCLKNSKLAEYAGKQFTDVYKAFMN
jgi:hypothetical protein